MCVCVCVGWGGGWKLCYGRVHGQIHLAAQFTSGVLCVCVFVWGGVGAESSVMVEFMVKFIWQHNLPVGSYGTFKMPPGRLDFWCSKGKKWDPPVTPKLKVREVSQSGFWNISSHPTSEPSFSQIGWPQLLAPGTLSQTHLSDRATFWAWKFNDFLLFLSSCKRPLNAFSDLCVRCVHHAT